MEIFTFTNSYISRGSGNSTIRLIGQYFTDGAPVFGDAIENITIEIWVLSMDQFRKKNEIGEVIFGDSEVQKIVETDIREHTAKFPRHSFSRGKREVTIELVTKTPMSLEELDEPYQAPPNLRVFKSIAHEVISEIKQFAKKLTQKDNFDKEGFIDWLDGKLNNLPDAQAMREFQLLYYSEEAVEQRKELERKNRKKRTLNKSISEDDFWNYIGAVDRDALAAGSEDVALAPLTDKLQRLNEEQLDSFDDRLAMALYQLDTLKHAEGTGILHGTDGFLYARCFVVGMGREHYNKVLQNPELFPQTFDEWFEPLLYVTKDAWEAAHNEDRSYKPFVSYETGSNSAAWK